MAKLDAAKRNALPASKFAEPAKRSYPVNDKNHAVQAKARATQAVNAGRMSKSTEAKIDTKANAVLAKKGGGAVPALSAGYTPMGSAKSGTKKRGY